MKSAREKIAEKKAPLDAKRGKRGGARPGAGRKKGGKSPRIDSGADIRLMFRISRELKNKLDFIAKSEKNTPANLLRGFINSKFEELQKL